MGFCLFLVFFFFFGAVIKSVKEDQEMALEDGQDNRVARIASAIRVIPNFPKPGTVLFILFYFWYLFMGYGSWLLP